MRPIYTKDLTDISLYFESSLGEVIDIFNKNRLQFVVLINDAGVIKGTITDGDIRRGFSKGLSIADRAMQVANQSPVIVHEKDLSDPLSRLLFSKNSLKQIPVVNSQSVVVGVWLSDNSSSRILNGYSLFILAGGRGSRMCDLTNATPKPMLKVAGLPILEHVLLEAIRQGIRKFFISVHYLQNQIMDYFGDGGRYGVEINYVFEKTPLGTAGCLSGLKDLGETPLMVANCDVLSGIDYADLMNFHKEHNAYATMVITEYTVRNPFGVVEVDRSTVVGITEKPEHKYFINAGVYVLNSSVIKEMVPNKAIDMTDFLVCLLSQGRQVSAYRLLDQWIDVGTPDDLETAKSFVDFST